MSKAKSHDEILEEEFEHRKQGGMPSQEFLLDTGEMFVADTFSGEGKFLITDEWEQCGILLKCDILKNWINELDEYYDELRGSKEAWENLLTVMKWTDTEAYDLMLEEQKDD